MMNWKEKGIAMKTSFVINRIATMDYTRFFKTLKSVQVKSKKNIVFLFFDMIYCGIVYQSGYIEYDIFDFYRLSAKQRDSYLTRGRNNAIIKRLNNPRNWEMLGNKAEFDRVFNEYIHRDYLDLRNSNVEELDKFIQNKEYIIGKILNSGCGKGIFKLKVSDYQSTLGLWDYLKKMNIGVVEELVIQHHVLSEIHPFSVNTLRIMTILVDGVPYIPCIYLRIGNGKHVDNLNSGGWGAVVDTQTGIIPMVAVDKDGNVAERHPLTGAMIKGVQLPFFEEAKEMCRRASHVVEGINIVGWDISVTENGPLLIEGNPFPGNDLTQLPVHMVGGYGRYHDFMDIIEGRVKHDI
jgi:glutathione synthase/RimK-type ligase-like ATP-grasp enzyme